MENGRWGPRTERERCREFLETQNIAACVKAQRVRWLGHVYRIPEHSRNEENAKERKRWKEEKRASKK